MHRRHATPHPQPRRARRSYSALLAVFLVTLAACGTDAEPEAEDECATFPSANIRLVVPYNPGGAMDLWGRLAQQVLEEHLPNDATVIVDNRGGAGSLIGTTAVYNSEPNGYTIGLMDPAQIKTIELQGNSELDVTAIKALARLTLAPEVVVVASESDIQTIEDLQALADEGPVIMSAGGIAAVNIVSFDAMGIPFEALNHDGAAEALLALQRGDGDVSVFTLANMLQGLRAGDFRPLAVIGTRPSQGEAGYEEIGQVPTIDEITGTEGLGGSLEQNRILYAPVETPDCIVDILSDALVAGLNDPAFLASVAEAGEFPPSPLDAASTQAIVENVSEQLTQYQDLLLALAD